MHPRCSDFSRAAGRDGVTHLTGTPCLARALMSPANAGLPPRYVRLSGEDRAVPF